MSIGLNGDFGNNIKKYQQMQQTKFGQVTAKGTGQNTTAKADMNSSIFSAKATTSSGNTTGTKKAKNGAEAIRSRIGHGNQANQVQSGTAQKSAWDYAYERQMAAQKSGKSNGASQTGQTAQNGTLNAINTITSGLSTIFQSIKSDKAAKAQAAQGNSQPGKTAGKDAAKVDNAKTTEQAEQAKTDTTNDKKAVEKQNKTDKKQEAQATTDNKNAVQNEQKTEAQQQTAETKKNEADNKLGEANENVSTAEKNLETAKGEVTSAEAELKQAEAAATKDNPNTEAINAAKQKLEAARAKQKEAEQQLEQAKGNQSTAQENATEAGNNLDTAKAEHSQAATRANATGQALAAAQTTQKASASAAQDLAKTETKADQKIEELRQAEGNNTDNNTPQGTSTNNQSQVSPMEQRHNDYIKNAGFTADEQNQIMNSKAAIMNMQPGETIQCGPDTYTMDKNGTIRVNDTAGEFSADQREAAARCAADSTMREIKAKKHPQV